MKTLVLFYSLDGNTRFIAETIAREIGADILEVKRRKEFKYGGFGKFFFGGFEAISKAKPEILPLEKKISDYDLIFIGTPVWAGNANPVFNSLFSTEKCENKSVALFCCYGGSEGKTLTNIKLAINQSIVVGEKGFKMPLKYDKDNQAEDAKKWAQGIISSV